MDSIGPAPLTGSEMVLKDLATRMSSGKQLTFVEEGMAMIATAVVTGENFGPGPSTMKINRPELPENIKGVLAQYST